MRILKPLAAVAAGSILLAGLSVLAATSASASDDGPTLPGTIYLLNQKQTGALAGPGYNLDGATNANIVTSGDNTARPWASITVDTACPAGTAATQSNVRIPQVGVPAIDWDEVPLNAQKVGVDSHGRPFNDSNANPTISGAIGAYVTAQGGTGTLPLTVNCRAADGTVLGHFETPLTIVGASATGTWSVPNPGGVPVIKTATTTTLAASATNVEAGTSVALTATVAPAAATGTVQFLAGATALGAPVTVTGGTALLNTTALPVGVNAVTAVYSGDSAYATSTSAPVSVTVTVAAPRSTTTTLTVSPVSGDAYQSVVFTCAVAASTGAANGTAALLDGATVLGSVPVTAGVVPTFTTNVLGAGAHSLTCSFTGSAPYQNSASAPVTATYTLVGAVDDQTVIVTIPQGAITITTPYTPASPLDLGTAVLDPATSTYSTSAAFNNIVITDTRAGNLGFTASVVSSSFTGVGTSTFGGQYAGLTGVTATQVAGNALLSTDIVATNNAPFTVGLATPKVFATYPAGHSTGSAHLQGVFGVSNVPTSVAPGTYTATVTFTAV